MKTIPLTQGKMALVDDEDYPELAKRKWYARREKTKNTELWYACRSSGNRVLRMHTQIMGIIGIDHADRDGLNNQKINLRASDQSQNKANSRRVNKTGLRGVTQRRNTFRAQIQVHRRTLYLGAFPTAEDAGRAYDRAAVKQWGEFATLNFPNQKGQTHESAARLEAGYPR